MTRYFITGASKGLGKAIAEAALQRDEVKVVGIARSCTIEHPNYQHVTLDLSDTEAVRRFEFDFEQAKDAVLINNAGMLGETRHFGNLDTHSFEQVFKVNVIGLGILMDSFIKKAKKGSGQFAVCNISSGAGKYPIDGWNAYCASKAAVEMLSEVAAKEMEIERHQHIRVIALAPGIIDTGMQAQIRSASESEFSDLQRFLDYKNDGELATPKDTALKVMRILDDLKLINGVSLSVRDF